jgi:hypothetical protein
VLFTSHTVAAVDAVAAGVAPQQQVGDDAGSQARPSVQNQPPVDRKETAMRSDRKAAPMLRRVRVRIEIDEWSTAVRMIAPVKV